MKPIELSEILGRNPDIPFLFPVASKVLALAADERTSAKQLGDVIKADPLLSAKVLKIANSPFFGRYHKTTQIADAVWVLGARAIGNAVLAVSVLELMGNRCAGAPLAMTMWKRSLGIAVLAGKIARATDLPPEEAFVLGLMCDVGILAEIHIFPDEYASCIPLPGLRIDEMLDRERKVFGCDHQKAGEIMTHRWNLPRHFCEAIATHHGPVLSGQDQGCDLATVLKISATLVHALQDGQRIEDLNDARTRARDCLGIGREKLDEMLAIVPENVAEIASLFELKIDLPVSHVEAFLNANQQLVEMHEKYERIAQQLEEANCRFMAMATVDELTGLPNRRAFDDNLKRECARASRYNGKMVLAICHIDSLTACNERYGRQAADDAIRCIGRILNDSLRSSDMIGRFAGDEFAVLLPETELESARSVLERLRQGISAHSFQNKEGPFRLTLSIGAALQDPRIDGEKIAPLVRRANTMLSRAHETGGNCVLVDGDPDSLSGSEPFPRAA